MSGLKPEEAQVATYDKSVFKGDAPKQYQLKRYYTPADVAVHNSAHDCWVSYFGSVYDLTPLLSEYKVNPTTVGWASNLNLFSSEAQMQEAGWAFDWDDERGNRFKPKLLPSTFQNGLPSNSYWGLNAKYSIHSKALTVSMILPPLWSTLSLTLKGTGVLTLDFGNAYSSGTTRILLNDVEKDSAGASTPSKESVTIPFQNLDVLKIRAEACIMVITSLKFDACQGPLAQPIVDAAGSDISHWFDESTREPRRHVDPVTGLDEIYCPWGRYIHVPPQGPESDWSTDFGTPWWSDRRYHVGSLAERVRKVTIQNLLTKQRDTLAVPVEEKVEEIRERYLVHNAHAKSYTWKRLGLPLNMQKTLGENGMEDETVEFQQLGIDPDDHIPVIHLYFDDDLTEA
eukprot:TRINITY_DN28188_c0_g1_i1.p1 TRINITY_DN28188_c0_g1~~TRINITY_DN28188_c0_g1_i1.p1  ORF type:complete len:416 (+),score=46.82 TRINITY_DN28188_c0_g1_i1:54-1250(+)